MGFSSQEIVFWVKIGGGGLGTGRPITHTCMQRSACVLRHRKNILCARPTFRTRIAARGEHSALAANNPRAYCGAWTIFRARSQRLARVLRRGDNIPRAQPTICTRIGARGEHSARAANNPLAYCSAGEHSARAANKPHACRGARRTFQALSQEPVGNLKNLCIP